MTEMAPAWFIKAYLLALSQIRPPFSAHTEARLRLYCAVLGLDPLNKQEDRKRLRLLHYPDRTEIEIRL